MPKIPFWIFIVLAIIQLSAVRVDIMDIDASQYAEISREMAETGSYLELYDRGNEYLDKPPFLFWISAIGIKVFGVTNIGYKLPSILFAFFAIYATYRLGKLLYGEAAGRMGALIFGTSQAMFLMTNDIRTDTVLMSWTIVAIWLLKEWDVHRKLKYLLLGFGAIAFGMMSKGPIALMMPVFCFGGDWLMKREWKKFFEWRYILGILFAALLLLPMSIGLYTQFDMHPEKMVNGTTGLSGLRFFYWSQSFGRITGESPWNNGAGLDFLYQNMLWSFLPWIFLFSAALVINIIKLFKQKFRALPGQEWMTTIGFVMAYLALGSSKYQLPHYIFVAFPLAAIMTAALIKDFTEGKYKQLYKISIGVQWFIAIGLIVGVALIMFYVFPASGGMNIFLLACLMLCGFIIFNKKVQPKVFWVGAVTIMYANIFLTNHFYYKLMDYQLGNQMADYLHEEKIPAADVIHYRMVDPLNSFHYYANAAISADSTQIASGKYVLTQDEGLAALTDKGYDFEIVKQGGCFRTSELKAPFLNPNTREESLQDYYFLKIK